MCEYKVLTSVGWVCNQLETEVWYSTQYNTQLRVWGDEWFHSLKATVFIIFISIGFYVVMMCLCTDRVLN